MSASPATTRTPLAHADRLAVGFEGVRALDGVDLTVAEGELVALAGENGAGKSTLVRCLAGDLRPDGGDVRIGGQLVTGSQRGAIRCGVAVVWQHLELCENLDVAANVLLGGERRLLWSDNRFHARAREVLADLQIPLPDTSARIGSLSAGQRHLVAIAHATQASPRLLILDEPTASLGSSDCAQVEALTLRLRQRGTTVLFVSHDVDQMFRLADRVVVLRHGRVVGQVRPKHSRPAELTALVSGQEVDAPARRQLSRLHRLSDRLARAEPSSGLQVIVSALSAALGNTQLSIHLVEEGQLRLAATMGIEENLLAQWRSLPTGPAGGPPGVCAAAEEIIIDPDVAASVAWAGLLDCARTNKITSSWCIPFAGPTGTLGVITVLRPQHGHPGPDELELGALYAGYAAHAVERDRLVDQLTSRNQVLETIREVLETLAGPLPLASRIAAALAALRTGLQADEVDLLEHSTDAETVCLGHVDATGARTDRVPIPAFPADIGAALCARDESADAAVPSSSPTTVTTKFDDGTVVVGFPSPAGRAAVVGRWPGRAPTDAQALVDDAAHCFRLTLEREESQRAHEETAALRRSQQLQRLFLSRLSHELRTPLTAIRGYASSLTQSDVLWDTESTDRFLSRISDESARVGRLVDDLLDFSAIEAGILRLQLDWCDLGLVLDAARSCLPPADADHVTIDCPPDLPAIWADHDRLEQVFLNLLDNAVRHNPPGTHVKVVARAAGQSPCSISTTPVPTVQVVVSDNGRGLPTNLPTHPYSSQSGPRPGTAGAGLGLSIVRGILVAHGGGIESGAAGPGTELTIRLPVEAERAGEPDEEPNSHGGPGRG